MRERMPKYRQFHLLALVMHNVLRHMKQKPIYEGGTKYGRHGPESGS